MSKREILDYEIRSSWWVGYVSHPVLQRIASKYFAWKVNRKCRRYRDSLRIRRLLVEAGIRLAPPTQEVVTDNDKMF